MKTLNVVRGQETIHTILSLFGDRASIIGGFARWALSPAFNPASAGDIDLYPIDMIAHDSIISQLQNKGYKPVSERQVAKTFLFEKGPLAGLPALQVIVPQTQGNLVTQGTLEEIINNFDFSVVRAGLVTETTGLVDDDFVPDEVFRNLRIKNIHCPISSVKRIAKYIGKGYHIQPSEIVKLYDNWDNRDSEYKQNLKGGLERMEQAGGLMHLPEEDRLRLATLLYMD